jgi:hypothetical protein
MKWHDDATETHPVFHCAFGHWRFFVGDDKGLNAIHGPFSTSGNVEYCSRLIRARMPSVARSSELVKYSLVTVRIS